MKPALATTLALPALALALPLALALVSEPAQAQLFADVETKRSGASFGRFTILLDHSCSPYTVANFIRLAEGTQPWLDPTREGRLKSGPFYDRLTFHSTSPGLEIASGSPSGDGTDGPGYLFRDDFRSAVSVVQCTNQSQSNYSVYMENDGPNTNGSRFFISLTGAPHPALRSGRYTRFGEVLIPTNPPGANGRQTVFNISNAADGFVTIDSVKIRDVGPAAVGFRSAMNDRFHPVHSLAPSVRATAFTFRRSAGRIFLDWDDSPGSIVRLWGSTDLRTWIGPLTAANVPGGPEFGFDLTSSIQFSPTGFFRGGVTDYPDWPSVERPLPGSVIQTNFFDPAVGNLTSVYAFDSTGASGNYTSALGSGTFTVTMADTPGPYATVLELTPDSGPQPTYRLTLHYDLAWTNTNPLFALPITANPSRLEGINTANPATPLEAGQWTYTGSP